MALKKATQRKAKRPNAALKRAAKKYAETANTKAITPIGIEQLPVARVFAIVDDALMDLARRVGADGIQAAEGLAIYNALTKKWTPAITATKNHMHETMVKLADESGEPSEAGSTTRVYSEGAYRLQVTHPVSSQSTEELVRELCAHLQLRMSTLADAQVEWALNMEKLAAKGIKPEDIADKQVTWIPSNDKIKAAAEAGTISAEQRAALYPPKAPAVTVVKL